MPKGIYNRSEEHIEKLREIGRKPRSLRNGGYSAIHMWLIKHYGKANKCENYNCNKKSKRFYYCLIKGKEYKHNRDNFKMLCASCHRRYDDNDEWRRNIGKASKGRIKTTIHKKAISDALKGQNIGNQRSAKAVIQSDLKGNPIRIWNSAIAAAQFLRISVSGISMCCHGKLKLSGGYKWNFYSK